MDKKSKKTIIRVITFSATAVALMAVFLVRSEADIDQKAENAARAEETAYRRAFSEIVSSVEDINYSLEKAKYVSSPSLCVSIYSEIFSEAQAAAACMGVLPYGGAELEQTAAFIAKAGDYCYSLAKKAASGQPRSTEDTETINALSQSAQSLAASLIELQSLVYSDGLQVSSLYVDIGDVEVDETDTVESFENDFIESPSLVYDGPFSEHIEAMEPVFLKGKQEVSEKEAQEKAEIFFDLRKGVLSLTGEVSGKVPAYIFEGEDENGGVYVQVTKIGGEMLYMSRTAAEEGHGRVTRDGALELAKKFLDENGVSDMQDTYTQQSGNVIVINYAYGKNDIICYSDLVKVTVDLTSGHIIGYEARGYIMSHGPRELAEPQISAEDAKGMVTGELTVLSTQLCVIPTSGKNELYCIELKCENADGKHYLLYINAITGAEEKLLILLEDENGTLSV